MAGGCPFYAVTGYDQPPNHRVCYSPVFPRYPFSTEFHVAFNKRAVSPAVARGELRAVLYLLFNFSNTCRLRQDSRAGRAQHNQDACTSTPVSPVHSAGRTQLLRTEAAGTQGINLRILILCTQKAHKGGYASFQEAAAFGRRRLRPPSRTETAYRARY